MHVVYTGKRIRIRPFRTAQEFINIDDEIMSKPNQYWGPNWRAQAERDAEFSPSGLVDPGAYSAFAIERIDTSELIGIEEHGEMGRGCLHTWLGTHILEEHWHNGFGIEAKQLLLCYLFENYPLCAVRATTIEHHVRARSGLEASGMRLEGRLHSIARIAGHYYDEVYYVISRAEWERLPIRQIVKRG